MTTSEAESRSQAAAARLRVTVASVADRVVAELRLQLAEGVLLLRFCRSVCGTVSAADSVSAVAPRSVWQLAAQRDP